MSTGENSIFDTVSHIHWSATQAKRILSLRSEKSDNFDTDTILQHLGNIENNCKILEAEDSYRLMRNNLESVHSEICGVKLFLFAEQQRVKSLEGSVRELALLNSVKVKESDDRKLEIAALKKQLKLSTRRATVQPINRTKEKPLKRQPSKGLALQATQPSSRKRQRSQLSTEPPKPAKCQKSHQAKGSPFKEPLKEEIEVDSLIRQSPEKRLKVPKTANSNESLQFIGRRVRKEFDDGTFEGVVKGFNKFFKVVYEDGDKEDCELEELLEILMTV